MTDEREYLLKAISALADALAYIEHVKTLRGLHNNEKSFKKFRECRTWQDIGLCSAQDSIIDAYNHATTVYEGLK